jgi:hypothetical protein
MGADPVPQEAGGKQDDDLFALDGGQGHLAQPAAVLDLADILAQTATDPGPGLGDRVVRYLAMSHQFLPCVVLCGRRRHAELILHAKHLPPSDLNHAGAKLWPKHSRDIGFRRPDYSPLPPDFRDLKVGEAQKIMNC